MLLKEKLFAARKGEIADAINTWSEGNHCVVGVTVDPNQKAIYMCHQE